MTTMGNAKFTAVKRLIVLMGRDMKHAGGFLFTSALLSVNKNKPFRNLEIELLSPSNFNGFAYIMR